MNRLVSAFVVSMLLLGCGPKPAASLQTVKLLELRTASSVPAPAVVAKDSAGAVVATPPLRFRVEPAGLVDVIGTSLTPVRNGEGTLVVEAGALAARVPVSVKVVDELVVTCPPPCAGRVGEPLTLQTSLRGLGAPVADGTVALTGDDGVKIAGSALQFSRAGDAKITARAATAFGAPLASPLERVVSIHVEPRVDRLRMTCPWPLFSVQAKVGDGAPAQAPTTCSIEPDFATQLQLDAYDGDEKVAANVEWSSSEPGVSVSGIGSLLGHAGGRALVRAKVGNAEVMMPVTVLTDGCDANRGHTIPASLPMTVVESLGFQVTGIADTEMRLMCQTNTGVRCIESGFASAHGSKVEKLAGKQYVDIDIGIVRSAAHRCCCVDAP